MAIEAKINSPALFERNDGIYTNPIGLMWSMAVLTSAGYGLIEYNLYHAITHHKTGINHTLLNISLFSTLILVTMKIYLENVRAPMKKEKLSYETHRQWTHAGLALILISSVAFNFALYPKYGFFKTCLIAAMVGYGIVWQFFMLVPWTWAQNIAGVIGGVYFLQEYAGVGIVMTVGY